MVGREVCADSEPTMIWHRPFDRWMLLSPFALSVWTEIAGNALAAGLNRNGWVTAYLRVWSAPKAEDNDITVNTTESAEQRKVGNGMLKGDFEKANKIAALYLPEKVFLYEFDEFISYKHSMVPIASWLVRRHPSLLPVLSCHLYLLSCL